MSNQQEANLTTEPVKARRKQRLPKSITQEEFFKLMKSVRDKDRESKVAFLISFGSGLRLSEVKNLKPDDITDRIWVRQGKYSKDRVVSLPKGWKEWMYNHIPIKKSKRSLERNFKMAAKKSGIDIRYTFHSLRHGFATHLVNRGMSINQVQVLLGHSNVATTNVYIIANPLEAMKKYEEIF